MASDRGTCSLPAGFHSPADPWLGRSQVLLIPTLLLLSPLLSPLPSRVSNPVVTFGGAITFAVGMCLIGVPATFLGLVVAACRVAIEGYRWHLLKSAMGGERAGSVLLMTTVVRGFFSFSKRQFADLGVIFRPPSEFPYPS